MESFGERLKSLREKKKMTQDAMAELMEKKNKTVISSWELNKNQPSMDEIAKMAKFFGVTTDFLFFGVQSNVMENNEGDEYVKISKDRLIFLQGMAIEKQTQTIEYQQQSITKLKHT